MSYAGVDFNIKINFLVNKMIKYFKVFVCFIVLSALSSLSFAKKSTEIEYSPADFMEGEKTLHARIKFPKWDEDIALSVRCDARLSRYGTILSNWCFANGDKYAVFEKEIHRAAKRAKLNPAMVDGMKEAVWFQYIVTFYKKGKERAITIHPNYGLEADKSGRDYTSPQRYSKGVRYFFNRCRLARTKIWIKARIDEKGKAHDVELVDGNGGNRCIKNLTYKFALGKFIPAHLDGKPVSALYMEAFFYEGVAKRR